MKRTHFSTVLAYVLGGIVVGYLGDLAIVSAGSKALVPPISLAITLVGVAAVVVALAWPIRRAVTGKTPRRLDPFRAMRVAVLAKACSLSGALVLGIGVGIALFLLTRTVLPPAGVVWQAAATAIGAAVLLAAGLFAEWCCTLPPDDHDEKEEHAHA